MITSSTTDSILRGYFLGQMLHMIQLIMYFTFSQIVIVALFDMTYFGFARLLFAVGIGMGSLGGVHYYKPGTFRLKLLYLAWWRCLIWVIWIPGLYLLHQLSFPLLALGLVVDGVIAGVDALSHSDDGGLALLCRDFELVLADTENVREITYFEMGFSFMSVCWPNLIAGVGVGLNAWFELNSTQLWLGLMASTFVWSALLTSGVFLWYLPSVMVITAKEKVEEAATVKTNSWCMHRETWYLLKSCIQVPFVFYRGLMRGSEEGINSVLVYLLLPLLAITVSTQSDGTVDLVWSGLYLAIWRGVGQAAQFSASWWTKAHRDKIAKPTSHNLVWLFSGHVMATLIWILIPLSQTKSDNVILHQFCILLACMLYGGCRIQLRIAFSSWLQLGACPTLTSGQIFSFMNLTRGVMDLLFMVVWSVVLTIVTDVTMIFWALTVFIAGCGLINALIFSQRMRWEEIF